MFDIDRINELVGNQEFEEAKKIIIPALKEEPDNLELIKLAGLTDVNLEDWDSAKKYFETVVKYNSEDATSWFYLGNSYEKLGDFISAKNSYIKVTKLRKDFKDAYKNL